jgi:hypothetical protein
MTHPAPRLEAVTPGGIVRGDEYAGAEFSPCGRYRFRLWRDIRTPLEAAEQRGFAPCRKPRLVAWCMLNPSTADERVLDPTLRRCEGFTRAWGYDGFVIVNLFAWRATDPRELRDAVKCPAPIGDGNGGAIDDAASRCELVVCGWGAFPAGGEFWESLGGRTVRNGALARIWDWSTPHHLGLTKGGHPRHPLYLRGDVKPQPWGRM